MWSCRQDQTRIATERFGRSARSAPPAARAKQDCPARGRPDNAPTFREIVAAARQILAAGTPSLRGAATYREDLKAPRPPVPDRQVPLVERSETKHPKTIARITLVRPLPTPPGIRPRQSPESGMLAGAPLCRKRAP